MEAEFYINWNSSTVDHSKILPASQSMYQSQSWYYTHQCFWGRHLLYREKKNEQLFQGHRIHYSASIPLSRTCWARTFNGLTKAQWWCRPGECIFESCPTGSLCSLRITTPECCFTHSQKENLDLGTKGWKLKTNISQCVPNYPTANFLPSLEVTETISKSEIQLCLHPNRRMHLSIWCRDSIMSLTEVVAKGR